MFFLILSKEFEIFNILIPKLNKLYKTYWEVIKTSKAIKDNQKLISSYNDKLSYNEMTMLGLITQGGQGLATGNNGEFIGCRKGSKEEFKIIKQRTEKLFRVVSKYNNKIIKRFPELKDIKSKKIAEDFLKNLNEIKIRNYFSEIKNILGRDIFGQGFLYRIIDNEEIVDEIKITEHEKLYGLKNDKKIYVKYDKGDKDGNRWLNITPYYIDWSDKSVDKLRSSELARWQGYDFFLKEGFSWSDIHTTYLKSRIKESSIHDVKSMSLFSINDKISNGYLVSLINSKFISEFQQDFLNNTSSFQINDARKIPVIVPDNKTNNEFEKIFKNALDTKRKFFENKISIDQHDSDLDKIENLNDRLVENLYLNQDIN